MMSTPLFSSAKRSANSRRFFRRRTFLEYLVPIVLILCLTAAQGVEGSPVSPEDSNPSLSLSLSPSPLTGSKNVSSTCVSKIWPCSRTVFGNFVLLLMYGIILAFGAKLISDGSELLLEILDPGVIGGFVLPVLGAVPDAAIIVVSGIGGTVAEAQSQLDVGIGTLAGSTVMLLTIPYGISIILARCDLRNGEAVDRTLTKGWSATETGVTVAEDVPKNVLFMLGTSLTYFIIQSVAFKYATADSPEEQKEAAHAEKYFALTALIICILAFLSYSIFQVRTSQLQSRKMREAREAARRNQLLTKWKSVILTTFSTLSSFSIRSNDGSDSGAENTEQPDERTSLLGASTNRGHNDQDVRTFATRWRNRVFDARQKAIRDVERQDDEDFGSPTGGAVVEDDEIHTHSEGEGESASESGGERERDGDSKEKKLPAWKIAVKSFSIMLTGVAMVCVFSDPMVDVISEFGAEIGISAFYISFVVTPVCSNASEFISSLIFAMRKRRKTSTITFGQLYGAATMNNTMCLGIFVALVYFRGLDWTYSAEVLGIFLVTVCIGAMSLKTTLKLWKAYVALALYPLCIVFIYLLETLLHWH